jgi:hypothetical protein
MLDRCGPNLPVIQMFLELGEQGHPWTVFGPFRDLKLRETARNARKRNRQNTIQQGLKNPVFLWYQGLLSLMCRAYGLGTSGEVVEWFMALVLLPNELKARLDIRVEQIAKEKEKAEIKAKAEAKRLAAERAERATWGDWSYNQFTDDATGKSYKRASVRSENSINLGFPYSGAQYGTLYLRQHPRWGFDAFVAIRQGQILCGEYRNTSILIRFDEGPAVKYGCNEPADLSSETLFIRDAQNFEVGLKRAQKAYITLNLYQGGQKTFVFKVKGYDSGKV